MLPPTFVLSTEQVKMPLSMAETWQIGQQRFARNNCTLALVPSELVKC